MSIERYHSKQHIENYDTEYVGLHDESIEIVVQEIDDLLYPEPDETGLFRISAQRARANGKIVTTMFSHEYLRTDRPTMGWAVENVNLSIDHTVYLGNSALRQCYKVRVDSSVLQSVSRGELTVIPPENRVTSIYYLEELARGDVPFRGLVLRPNVVNEPDAADESMTTYDCNQLFKVLSEVTAIAKHDAREAKTLSAYES